MGRSAQACVLLLAAAAVTFTANAAVLRTLYLDDLAGDSAVVVHASVISQRSEWNAAHTAIFTIYTMRAHQYLKGFLGETFEVRQRGGEVDNWVMVAAGSPEFRAGEEAVLFLWTDGASGRYQCNGFEQGVLRVTEVNGIKTVNRSIPVNTADIAANALRSARGTGLSLGAALGEISLAVARAEISRATKEAR